MHVANRPLILALGVALAAGACGTDVSSQLTAPLTVRVRTSREGG